MRIKAFIAVAAVAISGALATTEASASQLAPTEVTIQAESGGDFFGYVQSSDDNCESGRKVTLFRMLGSSPDRSVDQKIGSDTAEPNGPDSMWSTGNTGQRHGKFYARVAKTTYCQGDVSPVVKAQQ
jgi:hypothetical protein